MKKQIEKRDLLLLGAVGILLFFLVLYGVWFRPRIREAQRLRRELHDLRIQRKDTETLEDVSRLKERIQEIEKIVQEKRFRRNEIPRILELLKGCITEHRLEALSLKPELREVLPSFALAPDLTFETIPIHLHLKGDYIAMGEFLGILRELPFLTSVEFLSMESPPEAFPKVEAHLTFSLYLEKEEGVARER